MFFRVAGVSFRQDSLRECHSGDLVILEDEPDNEYDPHAVKVMAYADDTSEPLHIGYVPRQQTAEIKAITRQGYSAAINKIGKPENSSHFGAVIELIPAEQGERQMAGSPAVLNERQRAAAESLKTSLGSQSRWKPKEGANRIRIVPHFDANADLPCIARSMHFRIGPKGVTVPCLAESGQRCLVCEYADQLRASGQDEAADALLPKMVYEWFILDMNTFDETAASYPVMTWGASAAQTEQILGFLLDDAWGDVTGANGGRICTVTKTPQGGSFPKITIQFAPTPHPVDVTRLAYPRQYSQMTLEQQQELLSGAFVADPTAGAAPVAAIPQTAPTPAPSPAPTPLPAPVPGTAAAPHPQSAQPVQTVPAPAPAPVAAPTPTPTPAPVPGPVSGTIPAPGMPGVPAPATPAPAATEPAPDDDAEGEETPAPKKKRGRPKGSKNKKAGKSAADDKAAAPEDAPAPEQEPNYWVSISGQQPICIPLSQVAEKIAGQEPANVRMMTEDQQSGWQEPSAFGF